MIRGEGAPQNKFFILYDADFLYLDDFKYFEELFRVFLEVGEEVEEHGRNLKVILLLEASEKVSLRRLCRRKEKYSIEPLHIVQEA